MSNIPTRPQNEPEDLEEARQDGVDVPSREEVEKIVDSHRTEKRVEDLGGEID